MLFFSTIFLTYSVAVSYPPAPYHTLTRCIDANLAWTSLPTLKAYFASSPPSAVLGCHDHFLPLDLIRCGLDQLLSFMNDLRS